MEPSLPPPAITERPTPIFARPATTTAAAERPTPLFSATPFKGATTPAATAAAVASTSLMPAPRPRKPRPALPMPSVAAFAPAGDGGGADGGGGGGSGRFSISSAGLSGATPEPPPGPYKTPPASRLSLDHNRIHTPADRLLTMPDRGACASDEEFCRTSIFEQSFELQGKLGEGSGGTVMRCRCLADGSAYAVKRASWPCVGPKAREELSAILTLQKHPHPNLVRLHHAWTERELLHTQWELCEKGTLRDEIGAARDAAPIAESKLWTFLVDVLLGLSHVHGLGLVHLDLKPANMFLAAEALKIGDFGHMAPASCARDGMEGDARYMAHELLGEGSGGADRSKCDIFSLGMTMLELITLDELPSNGDGWLALRQGKLPPLPVSAELSSLVASMLAPEPSERPSCDTLLEKVHQKLKTQKRKRKIDKLSKGEKRLFAQMQEKEKRMDVKGFHESMGRLSLDVHSTVSPSLHALHKSSPQALHQHKSSPQAMSAGTTDLSAVFEEVSPSGEAAKNERQHWRALSIDEATNGL